MIRVMIVDDEQYARQELALLLGELGDCEIAASCANAIEALKQLNRASFDLLFLDIQMPVIDGFELLAMVDPERMPHIVFVTAYDDYALKAFEENTLDYLLKPVEKARLEKTFDKLRRRIQAGTPGGEGGLATHLRYIPCQMGNQIKLVVPEEVEAVRSDQTGVHLLVAKEALYTELTLKVLAEQTPLIHCHRQYLINPDHIASIQLLDQGLAKIQTKGGLVLPVSRRYMKTLKSLFFF